MIISKIKAVVKTVLVAKSSVEAVVFGGTAAAGGGCDFLGLI